MFIPRKLVLQIVRIINTDENSVKNDQRSVASLKKNRELAEK